MKLLHKIVKALSHEALLMPIVTFHYFYDEYVTVGDVK